MNQTTRSTGCTEALKLEFVERVCTSQFAMQLGIELHLRGLFLSNTVDVLENCGVDRCRTAVHNWVKKSDLKARDGRKPAKIALDEITVKIGGVRYWLFAAVNPETNNFLHVGIYFARTTVATKMFLNELQDKHTIDEAEFFVDGVPWLQAGLFELGIHFRHETHVDRNPVDRQYQEI